MQCKLTKQAMYPVDVAHVCCGLRNRPPTEKKGTNRGGEGPGLPVLRWPKVAGVRAPWLQKPIRVEEEAVGSSAMVVIPPNRQRGPSWCHLRVSGQRNRAETGGRWRSTIVAAIQASKCCWSSSTLPEGCARGRIR